MTFTLRMDLSESGFDMFFKDYMKIALDVLWDHPEGLSTRQAWEACNEALPGSISRASVINFLAWAADLDILTFREISGKGGYRRIYVHNYDKDGLSQFLKAKVDAALQTM